jgi:acetolactate synthase-1/2/3 large subunit
VNGAEALIQTLVNCGATTCFANPGTTELEIVAALDSVSGVRAVPVLFEGVAVGAADGYGRMSGRLAFSLLHTGAGLSNGLSNMLNAGKANTPLLTLVGDHPVRIREWNHTIASGIDIPSIVRPYSSWVRRAGRSTVGRDAADAVAASFSAPGGPTTLVVPSDVAWSEDAVPGTPVPPEGPATVSGEAVRAAVRALRSGEPAALLLHGSATGNDDALRAAGRIAAQTGCRVMARPARLARGAGRVPVEFFPYNPPFAIAALRDVRHVILVGAHPPVAPWAYPDDASTLVTHDDCQVSVLARPEEDAAAALSWLADELGATSAGPVQERVTVMPGSGAVTPEALAASIATLIPEGAVVIDESVTTGRRFHEMSRGSRPHDWITNLGGALGYGQPLAIGSAIACPDRKVLLLQGDGAGMYMPQSLWTIAREALDVLVVVFANRSYSVLRRDMELRQQDAEAPAARALFDIGRPEIDWIALAGSLGVPASRVGTMEEFNMVVGANLKTPGPALVQVDL